MEIGRKVVENQTDPQYLFLSERLDGIEENWVALHKMYEDRDKVLKRDVEAQVISIASLSIDSITQIY